VEELMAQDWSGIQQGNSKYKAEIIKVGLEHSLATQYTSFVAVEERTVVQDGKPVRVEVPVELPEGVSPLAVPGPANEKFPHQYGLMGRQFGFSPAPAHDSLLALGPGLASPTPHRGSTSETVEVTSQVAMIDTSPQVSHTFDGALLHGPAGGGGGGANKAPKINSRKLLESKLSPDLLALYRCSVLHQAGATGVACKPVLGLVKIKIELAAASAEAERELMADGFTLESGSGGTELSGSILPAKLKQVVLIGMVKSVTLAEAQTK